ncbi:uncharacterized protein LOC114334183 [Diabrotica virgifera virgifera]|uniref:Uncharacterized protein LOC114334183 n=1 Tax=Diabrotica virgifera virgifera TaxID=50390 RepID=A0A6P7FU98_DIAVI|nr:uncharacterized protein LOC114334183 [Diabrotica virgifera virgifera]
MSCTQIKQLETLLRKQLTKKTIKNVNISRLTEPGENFGSIMYKLDIVLSNNDNGTEEILQAVAKTLPDTELWRKIFNIQVTYTNEMAFYEIVLPTFLEFQRSLGINEVINCFAECLAVRKNLLENSDIIDDDAVIVLENLIPKGYNNIDRFKGFDLNTTKIILKDIAHLHAVALSLKLKDPKTFDEKVKKYCHVYEVPKEHNTNNGFLKALIAENEECRQYVSRIHGWGEIAKSPPREPFATVVHEDLWTNNTMQKFENGQPIGNKLVDLQIYEYGSPAADVFFFIFSSIPLEVLKRHLDDLLHFYHESLTSLLKKHKCDLKFSYDQFLEEMEFVSAYEFGHALLFHIIAVNGKKGGRESSEEIPSEDKFLKYISQPVKEKAWYMVKECVKRGWLK